MSVSLKTRLLLYLQRQPMQWLEKKFLQDMAVKTGYVASTASTALKELVEERLLEGDGKRFRYNPDVDYRVLVQRGVEWFNSLPEKTD